MEHTSLSDALISLIPTYGPWIIFGIVALESAGVPFPGETILVAAALLAASTGSDQHRRRRTGGRSRCDRSGTVPDTWSDGGLVCPFFTNTVTTSGSIA